MALSKQQQQLIVAAVVVLAAIATAVSASNLEVGKWQATGRIHFDIVNLRAQPGRVVNATRSYKVPRFNQNVSYVFALDRNNKGKGGYARIVKGGIGKKNVTLHFWSQPNQPLNFTVNIYAKPYW